MSALTPAQAKMLDAIRAHFASHPYAPSIKELTEATGLGIGSVHGAIQRLKARGAIRSVYGRARSIELVENW